MSQRHRTGDSDSHSIDARSGLTRRQWLTRAAGAAAGVGLAPLGGLAQGPAFAQGAPKRGGTLRVATVDKPVNMDPGFAQLYSSLQVYQNVYSKLVNVDEAGQFVPGLAKSWKQENDWTWLFDRRQRRLHNGEPLTSKDVVHTFTRLLDPRTSCPCASSSRRWKA
jgi:peptide/nickel transport system substrate-binding protein